MGMNKFERVGSVFTQTQTALTDSSGGSAGATLAAADSTVIDTTNVGTINDNFASLAAQLALIKTDVADIMTKLNEAN